VRRAGYVALGREVNCTHILDGISEYNKPPEKLKHTGKKLLKGIFKKKGALPWPGILYFRRGIRGELL